jgi:uncharacterized protein
MGEKSVTMNRPSGAVVRGAVMQSVAPAMARERFNLATSTPEHLNRVKAKNMTTPEKTNYIEFPAKDLEDTKSFFSTLFGWSFSDYGPEYTSFNGEGIRGGFYKSDLSSSTQNGSALLIFFSNQLENTQSTIEKAGGSIVKPVFAFPGGRRFHFADPNGNEYAVWSDT